MPHGGHGSHGSSSSSWGGSRSYNSYYYGSTSSYYDDYSYSRHYHHHRPHHSSSSDTSCKCDCCSRVTCLIATSFFVFLLLSVPPLVYSNSWSGGDFEMEPSETRFLFSLPCNPSDPSCFLRDVSFQPDHAEVLGFRTPRPLLPSFRLSEFETTTTLEPGSFDFWEIHLNGGGSKISCEPASRDGCYFLMFKNKSKLNRWMEDGDSSAWFGSWDSKVRIDKMPDSTAPLNI